MNYVKLNYIKLIQAYWAKHRQELFTGNQTLLYWRLVDLFNAEGENDQWPESLRFMDNQLCLETGISGNTIDKFRKALVHRGLIEFEPAGKGYRGGGIYKLINTYSSSKRISKNEELPKRTSNFEEQIEQLLTKEPQKDTQKESQKDIQNLRFSYIYITKHKEKLIRETHKQKMACVFKNLRSFLQSKKRQRKSPLIPRVPPKPVVVPQPMRGDPFFLKRDSEQLNVPFSAWFNAYQLNVSEAQCRRIWIDLTDQERQSAKVNTPAYVKSTPNKRYRKSPVNYLDEKVFNDEIIERHANPSKNAITGNANPYGQGAVIPPGAAYRPQTLGRRNKTGVGDA